MAAVGSERIASVIGYDLNVLSQSVTSNLPQRVAVICPVNTDNQSTFDPSEWTATNLRTVGIRYGYGSPAYIIARVALPILGGIPLVFYPQAAALGATANTVVISPIGTASNSATHTIIISGRNGMDGQFYSYTVNTGDTSHQITAKQVDALSNVLGCPFKATDTDYATTLTSQWEDETANDLHVSIDTGGNDAGITYTINNMQTGAGVPNISSALSLMAPKWNTIGINAYGTNTTIAGALEQWNGVPDPTTPTGRYVGTVMKPILFLTGFNTEDAASFTDARKTQVTLSMSPGPISNDLDKSLVGLPMEAAANDAAIWAVVAQNTPELDVLNKYYVDMPAPSSIGAMEDYNERDRIVKLGCSTVDLVNNKYQLKDPVTTYHPDGEINPAYRWRRDLMVDFNLRYRYRLLEETFLVGKVISGDTDNVRSLNVIKPKQWKSIIIDQLLKEAVADGLITTEEFSITGLSVQIDSTNPNRFNTSFPYLKTGIVRISATTVQSGVNTFNI